MKKILCLFLALLLLSTVGCTATPSEKTPDEPIYAPNTESPDEDTPVKDDTPSQSQTPPEIPRLQTLRIAYDLSVEQYITQLVEGFSALNANVQIELIPMTSEQGLNSMAYVADVDEMVESGNSPDIFLYSWFTTGTDYVSSALSDRLLDINQLNDTYDYLTWSDYEEHILNAGMFDGERKIVPIYYQIPLLISTEEMLEKHSIVHGSGVTLAEFLESSMATTDAPLTFYQPLQIEHFLPYSGTLPVNQHTGTALYTSERVLQTLALYDQLYPEMYNGAYLKYAGKSLDYQSTSGIKDARVAALIDGKVLFLNEHPSSNLTFQFSNFYRTFDVCEKIVNAGQTPVLTAFPDTYGEDVVHGQLTLGMGISATTESPEGALRFLRYALSFEAYNTFYSITFMGIPVNKEFNQAVKSCLYRQAIDLPVGMKLLDFLPNSQFSYVVPQDHAILDQYYDLLSRTVISMQADRHSYYYDSNMLMLDIQKNGTPIDEAAENMQLTAQQQLTRSADSEVD